MNSPPNFSPDLFGSARRRGGKARRGALAFVLLQCLFVSFLSFLASPAAGADDLLTAYRLSLEHDAVIAAAEAEHRAVLETRPQARALLLPSLTLSADYARARNAVLESDNPFFFQPQTVYFWSRGFTLSLRQPVYNREYFAQLRQADAAVKAADARLAAARQALILRVAQGYFDVLAARDNLEFAEAEKNANLRQLEQARQRFEVGLIAITDVHESQAAFDAARAGEIEARNRLASALEALRVITGRHHEQLQPLDQEIPLLSPQPQDIDAWAQQAVSQNFAVLAAEYQVEVARQELARRRSGHYPTLDLAGRHNYSDVDDGFFGGRVTEDSSIGLVLNLPLYQGGGVSARVREAVQRLEKAKQELEQQRREALRQARDAYLSVLSGIETVKARKQAVVSAQSALEATEAGLEVGTRTTVDVLNVRRNLFRAERDYASSRYAYILDLLRLKQAAGTLAMSDLEEINGWLSQGP